MPEKGIPMFQRASKTPPDIEKTMFHVKHTPVQKLPSSGRRPLEKTKGIWVDQLKWQGLDEA